MAEEKESTSIPLSQADNASPDDISDPEDPAKSPPTSPNYSTRRVVLFLSFFFFFFIFNFPIHLLFHYYYFFTLEN